MKFRIALICMVLSSFAIPFIGAQGLPTVAPAKVGLSSDRLARLERVMQTYIDDRAIAGAVTLVARRGGQAHLRAYGMADVGSGVPMQTDGIFRIASMTKPITSVAVMMLYEEGRFRLNDPVGEYLPQLASLDVFEPIDAVNGTYKRRPAQRPVTIRHLLTHTSGITYLFLGNSDQRFSQRELSTLYREAGVTDGFVEHPGTIEELVTKLGKLPLMHDPGDAFSYGLSVDVLGRLVEVLSGTTLDQFLRARVFEPLGMDDTYFYLPQEKAKRLVSMYSPTPSGGIDKVEGVVESGYLIYSATYPTSDHRTYFSGGGGLSSTAPDYARFLQMLLNGGALDGVRLLSPTTVDLMTSDHIGTVPSAVVQPGSGGFGLGFAIAGEPNVDGEIGSAGAYTWRGLFNTMFWVDPVEELIGIMMTQLYPYRHLDIQDKFRIMTYQAIVER